MYMFVSLYSGIVSASRGEPDVPLHEVLTSDSLRPLSRYPLLTRTQLQGSPRPSSNRFGRQYVIYYKMKLMLPGN